MIELSLSFATINLSAPKSANSAPICRPRPRGPPAQAPLPHAAVPFAAAPSNPRPPALPERYARRPRIPTKSSWTIDVNRRGAHVGVPPPGTLAGQIFGSATLSNSVRYVYHRCKRRQNVPLAPRITTFSTACRSLAQLRARAHWPTLCVWLPQCSGVCFYFLTASICSW